LVLVLWCGTIQAEHEGVIEVNSKLGMGNTGGS
jgi:hypothetical protein